MDSTQRIVTRDQSRTRNKSGAEWVIPLFVVGLLGIVGVTILFLGIENALDAFASTNWATTQGTVVSYLVEPRQSTNKDNNTITTYYPHIVYHYQVKNLMYRSKRISFEEVCSDSAVDHWYKPGETIKVYYSPGDPSRAVLQAGANPLSFWHLGAGLLFALLGVPCTIIILYRMVRQTINLRTA